LTQAIETLIATPGDVSVIKKNMQSLFDSNSCLHQTFPAEASALAQRIETEVLNTPDRRLAFKKANGSAGGFYDLKDPATVCDQR
jgi:hypothetical protein